MDASTYTAQGVPRRKRTVEIQRCSSCPCPIFHIYQSNNCPVNRFFSHSLLLLPLSPSPARHTHPFLGTQTNSFQKHEQAQPMISILRDWVHFTLVFIYICSFSCLERYYIKNINKSILCMHIDVGVCVFRL